MNAFDSCFFLSLFNKVRTLEDAVGAVFAQASPHRCGLAVAVAAAVRRELARRNSARPWTLGGATKGAKAAATGAAGATATTEKPTTCGAAVSLEEEAAAATAPANGGDGSVHGDSEDATTALAPATATAAGLAFRVLGKRSGTEHAGFTSDDLKRGYAKFASSC